MRTSKQFTPETAGELLVSILRQIIDTNRGRCERISDDEGVTDYDNLMAAGIVSRIDYDEQTKEFILTRKDALHQDKTGQDIEAWTMRFLNKHSETVLHQLLARQFVRLLNEGLIGATTQKRPDRHTPLPEARLPKNHATA